MRRLTPTPNPNPNPNPTPTAMPNKLGGVAAALQGLPGSVDARAAGVFGSVLAAYVLLYTAYSKQSKKLSLRQLLDVILVRVSLDNTLVELNKAVSLAGLTCLAFAYCPYVSSAPMI
mmetsp:Transcript_3987/g.11593  ORF Transcript_3987/g.11593 Transcript_3987/m.11593 type:complete len:117 (-) Transcript_3987:31-381(-)